ncbi:phage holin-like protein [Gracilibacillus halophilus YIM-C55.5]|uniref:Phage holin-like protein n=1 Tax=Gracilibacillus halophilus YIM-C55.5 TaxID=1308866 RepID=N4WBU2_9BACI|nr:holin [Gracilibacillus halophilus]ENH96734.1 phage holin-like protein [Gracilibacillus halophilus YIM-C55.5]
MEQVLMFATVLLPIVTALIEGVKRTINVPKNIVPGISLGVGLVIGAVAVPFTDLDLIMRLWSGGFAGLASTGLFELTMNKRTGNTKDAA